MWLTGLLYMSEANKYAFAAIRGDRSVVTWGSSSSGGDSSLVQNQLRDVHEILTLALASVLLFFFY